MGCLNEMKNILYNYQKSHSKITSWNSRSCNRSRNNSKINQSNATDSGLKTNVDQTHLKSRADQVEVFVSSLEDKNDLCGASTPCSS